MAGSRWIAAGLLALAIATGLGFLLRRSEAQALRREIGLLREESEALNRAKAENERLKAAQVPPEELARLRADHAALVRLRQEVEELKRRAAAREAAK